MDPGTYLVINAIVVILLVGSILFLRKGSRSPTKLNLTKYSGNKPVNQNKFYDFNLNSQERSLNVVFQYQGEWFDAYEVLELPAGAQGPIIKTQFENLLKGADTQRSEILRLAYETLVQQGRA